MSSVATYISARTLVNEGRPQGSAYLREWVDLRVNQVLALILFALLSPLLLVIMGFIWRSDGPILPRMNLALRFSAATISVACWPPSGMI